MGLQHAWRSYNQLFNLLFPLFLCQFMGLHAQFCSQEQSSALLQLKRTFSFNKFASFENCDYYGITSFPKMESWKKGSDCCSWDGVDCDNKTGRVIGLDLSCSWLQGTFPPNNSLFLSFSHLQKLNLAYNDFFMSRIPHEFTRFTELTHLNLSLSNFSGKVPHEISFLNKLVLLDLYSTGGLTLEEGGFKLLTQNLTKLRDLDLVKVNTSSSVVTNSLLNLTSLRTLHLGWNGLRGIFPSGIFHLPNLQVLKLWSNEGLAGCIPNFINLTHPLQILIVSDTAFSGKLPDTIGNLKSLEIFAVQHCKLHGSVPTSLWNLPQILEIELRNNSFSGVLPSSISNLSEITYLGLSFNTFSGVLPYSWISNLKNLAYLYLFNNHFTGPFLSGIVTLPELRFLDVSNNLLTGPLPSQVIVPPNLYGLNIDGNLINGTIPSWVFELPALMYLDLSNNKLIGHILEFRSASLRIINLSNNTLCGAVPNSTFELRNLTHLILSSNSFSGTIPESNRFSDNLVVLQVQKNNFSGTIHDSFTMRNSLQSINLNGNGFEGPIPRSLVNCINLEVLDIGRNNFLDEFPHWLGDLPNLHVLVLQSNKFHGSIWTSMTKFPFPMLRVLDMSNNHFTGPLPEKYFKSFKAMMDVDEHFPLEYMGNKLNDGLHRTYYDPLTIVIKGSTIEMTKILQVFTVINLSSNKFQGEIPEIISGLNSIRGLNLSHNSLTGHIPKSLGNLTKLEWLDLSSNKLTGEIPPELTNLLFLGTLNLSQNRLMGPIPRGKQFDTFLNDSYANNSALCGPPLSNACGDPKATQPRPSTFEEEDSEDVSIFSWEVILPGYGFGLVVGLVMGYLMFSFGKPQWLVKKVESLGNRNGKKRKSNAGRLGGQKSSARIHGGQRN